MSDSHDTSPHRSELPRRLDLESPSSSGSMWPWLAALVAIVAILMLAIGYAHILAILLDQVEGIEDRFMRGLSSAQILKAARDKPSTLKGSGPTIGRGPSAGEGAAAWDDASRAVVNAE